MKQIVILGGGFAGVSCALTLDKLNPPDCEITLINDHEYHTLNFALYQAGTNEQSSRNVAIPLTTIFENKKINIKISKVDKIDFDQNKVITKKREEIAYDYLVIALGSETEDYGIPGVKEFAYRFKSLYDAAILRNQVKLLFENVCNDKECIYPITVAIAGGGFTGTELAGELHKYCSKLARQFALPQNCFEVVIIQSGNQLLNGLDTQTAAKAKERLEKLHVKIILGSHITKVEKNHAILENGSIIHYNFLIWTVGVRANSLSGKLIVLPTMQVKDRNNVFACGDCANFPNAPMVIPVAEAQGKIAAKNIFRLLTPCLAGTQANSQPLTIYSYQHYGYIIPISGKFALARIKFLKVDGFLAFIIQQLIVFYYLLSILPISKALHRWNNFEMELSNED